MLAELGLDVRVLIDNDNDGSPETAVDTTEDPLVVGQTFWVQVRAEDVDLRGDPDEPGREPVGVISLSLDLTWPDPPNPDDADKEVMQFAGTEPPAFPDEIPIENRVVTSDFTEQRFVTSFEPSAGNIQELRGGALPAGGFGAAIGAGEPGEFSLLQFLAVGAAKAMPFDVALAGSMSFADAAELESVVAQAGTIRIQAVVSGEKYEDLEPFGSKEDTDPPLPGWEIRAYRDTGDGAGGPPDGKLNQDEYDAGWYDRDLTDEDENGQYSLALDTGDPVSGEEQSAGSPAYYIIVEVLQGGWDPTSPDTPVLAPDLDTGLETLGEFGYAITVDVATGKFEDRDFGNTLITPSTSSLSGFVYADTDNDGERKVDEYGAPIEMGLPNVTISLFRDDQLRDQMRTGPGGRYHFEGLEPGTYEIREEQPDCFLDGRDGKDPDTPGIVWTGEDWEPRGEVGEDRFFDIGLGPGEHGVDYNFGELGLKAECINKRMFVASTPSAKEPVAERLGVETETILGTDGDDEIEFHAEGDDDETVLVVTVNGSEKEFPISETRMVFIDARGGDDSMTVTLTEPSTPTEPEEEAYALPGYATLRHETRDGILRDWDYGVEVVNAETIDVDDHAPGDNLTVMRDSPRSDALTAEDDTATLTTDELEGIARAVALSGVDRVMALSASGGDDTAKITPHDFVLERVGDWRLLPDP